VHVNDDVNERASGHGAVATGVLDSTPVGAAKTLLGRVVGMLTKMTR
jgi:hypothetical protein